MNSPAMLSTSAYGINPDHRIVDSSRVWWHISYLLDVLTPLSDNREESVEKMERRISGVSYMCWMDFHNGIFCCGFLCARLISFSFVFSLVSSSLSFPATTPRATTPHLYCTGYHAQSYHVFTTTARLPRLCIYISRLPRHSS